MSNSFEDWSDCYTHDSAAVVDHHSNVKELYPITVNVLLDAMLFIPGFIPISGLVEVEVEGNSGDTMNGRELYVDLSIAVTTSKPCCTRTIKNIRCSLLKDFVLKDGRHTSPFKFDLPSDVGFPSAFHNRNASVNYKVTGSLQMSSGVISGSSFANVCENATMSDYPHMMKGIAEANNKTFLFSKGVVELRAQTLTSMFYAGLDAFVRVEFSNTSSKTLHGFKIKLERHIMIMNGSKHVKKKSISSHTYNTKQFKFGAGECRSMVVNFTIPSNVFSIENVDLFSVRYFLVVKLLGANLITKDLVVYLPIHILHFNSQFPEMVPKSSSKYGQIDSVASLSGLGSSVQSVPTVDKLRAAPVSDLPSYSPSSVPPCDMSIPPSSVPFFSPPSAPPCDIFTSAPVKYMESDEALSSQ